MVLGRPACCSIHHGGRIFESEALLESKKSGRTLVAETQLGKVGDSL